MSKQKEIFLTSEGNSWYHRNREIINNKTDANDNVIDCIKELALAPKKILEIGCSNGHRLEKLRTLFNAECCGIDPSAEAIQEGKKLYPHLNLKQGTADLPDFKNDSFDLVIYGFCLYLCDRNDLFAIAQQGDRVLSDSGHILILDFHPPFPYKNTYVHYNGINSYKMDYSALFTWNPQYFVRYSKIADHHNTASSNPDERISITILQKDTANAYPSNPFTEKK